MANSNNPAYKFFKEGFQLAIAFYDARRGQYEGEEHDKLLGFYPGSTTFTVQTGVVGLAQALVAFTGNFAKDDKCCVMEGESNKWVIYNFEPDIWGLLVISKAWCTYTHTTEALTTLLKTVYAMFIMLNGSITQMIEQDVTAGSTRRKLHPFLHEVAQRLLQDDLKEYTQLINPLSMQQGCPFLPTSTATFLGVQSMVNHLLVTRVYNTRVANGVMVCWDKYLVWSSLNAGDTFALMQLASRTVLPVQQQAAKAKGARGVAPPSFTADSTLLSAAAWEVQPPGLVLPVTPVHPHVAVQLPGSDTPLLLPCVWLQGGEECSVLLPVSVGRMVVLLLLQHSPLPGHESITSLLDVLAPRAPPLAASLAAEVPAANLWHAPGYRYLYVDRLLMAVRATPLNKVSTLSWQSLAALAAAQEELALEVDCSSGSAEDLEIVCRTHHDCWIVAKRNGGRCLYVVMEQDKDGGIVGVMEHVQQFCDAYFAGMFIT